MKEIHVAGTASRGIVVSHVLKYEEPDYTPSGGGITAEQAEAEQETFEHARAIFLQHILQSWTILSCWKASAAGSQENTRMHRPQYMRRLRSLRQCLMSLMTPI